MSLQPEKLSGSVAGQAPLTDMPEFNQQEREILLRLAHEAIESALDGREIPLDPPSSHLAEVRGAFTTIYLQDQLRGCVGYVSPIESLYRTVADTARAAAFDDTRFWPVTREEAPQLRISLSILSALEEIEPDRVEVGRHGLLISLHGQRGLLLPQVPVEYRWTPVTFLEQTCRKAGLSTDAWKTGARVQAFTAEVFGDSNLK
jgi:AmmeMemoRadiSam system protein A